MIFKLKANRVFPKGRLLFWSSVTFCSKFIFVACGCVGVQKGKKHISQKLSPFTLPPPREKIQEIVCQYIQFKAYYIKISSQKSFKVQKIITKVGIKN